MKNARTSPRQQFVSRLLRRFAAICSVLLLAVFCSHPVSAAGSIGTYPSNPVYLDGTDTGIRAYALEDGVTYLSLREAAALLFPGAEIGWDREAAYLYTSRQTVTVPWGKSYIEANGRVFALSGLSPAPVKLIDDTTYVPIRLIARAAGADIVWNGALRRAELTSGAGYVPSGDTVYPSGDLYWLSRIIYAESGNQSFAGQLAVGSVVMNRVRDAGYPDSVYGVIFDRRFGVQFSPTANGAIYQTPSAESIRAAKAVLDGTRISGEALYFLDPDIASNFWIVKNCRALFSIGDHDFYS